MKEFGAIITGMINTAQMARKEIAQRVRICRGTLWNYESGKGDIPIGKLFEIADVLDHKVTIKFTSLKRNREGV